MSYCVNCGVELSPSEKTCPLCSVEVVNPRQPYDEKAVRPYPRRLDPINARIYAAGGLALVWVFAVPSFLIRKPGFSKLLLPDILALLLYLLMIAWLRGPSDWYLPLAMPLVLLAGGLVYVNGLLIGHRIIRGFFVPAVLLISLCFLVMGIELITRHYGQGIYKLNWSLFVMIPCLAAALACLAVARRQSIREEIKRRLHL